MRTAGGSLRGTGTLVDPQWVLTAAHVADDSEDWVFVLSESNHEVAEVFIHPFWTGNLNNNHDIALMRLTTPIDDIAPIPIAQSHAGLDDVVDIAGVGWTGTGLVGLTDHGGEQLRAGTNTVEWDLTSIGLHYIGFYFDAPGSGFETPLECMGAFNDSGGPVMRDTGNGWEVVAVTSFIQESLDGSGDGVLGNYDDVHGATKITLYASWIEETMVDPCAPDLNLDGKLDFFDVLLFLNHFANKNEAANFVDDGVFDFFDVQAFLSQFSAGCP